MPNLDPISRAATPPEEPLTSIAHPTREELDRDLLAAELEAAYYRGKAEQLDDDLDRTVASFSELLIQLAEKYAEARAEAGPRLPYVTPGPPTYPAPIVTCTETTSTPASPPPADVDEHPSCHRLRNAAANVRTHYDQEATPCRSF